MKGGVESVAYSPDGRTVAFGANRYLHLIDARTREELATERVADEGDAGVSRVAFTPDGSRLVVVSRGPRGDQIGVRDAATLEAIGLRSRRTASRAPTSALGGKRPASPSRPTARP